MATTDPFEPGRSIGQYEILRELGRGGMGRVYLAKDTAVGDRHVAIKVILSAERDEQSEAHTRFFHEIKNLARLDHRNIVTIFTAGNYEGYPYFVMQYIPGRDLMRFVYECATLGDRERITKIVKTMADVARAVHHAHQSDIVHRDLKPENILISMASDEPIILDFGIAKYMSDTSLTKGPESPGTPAYRAPEQIDVQRKVRDELIDVWALGVILYRVLTGTAPFKGNDFLSLSVQVLNSEPAPPRGLEAQIPPSLERVVLQCLSKDPRDRPQSALLLGTMLDDALAAADAAEKTTRASFPPSADGEATRIDQTPSRHEPNGEWRVARNALLALLAVAVTSASGWAIWTQTRRASHEGPPDLAALAVPTLRASPAAEAPDVADAPSSATDLQTIQDHVTRAATFLDDGQYEKATTEYEAILTLAGTNKDASAGIERAKRAAEVEVELELLANGTTRSDEPLTLDAIERLLTSGVTSTRTTALIEQQGLAFRMTDPARARLEAASADPQVLLAAYAVGEQHPPTSPPAEPRSPAVVAVPPGPPPAAPRPAAPAPAAPARPPVRKAAPPQQRESDYARLIREKREQNRQTRTNNLIDRNLKQAERATTANECRRACSTRSYRVERESGWEAYRRRCEGNLDYYDQCVAGAKTEFLGQLRSECARRCG